MLNIYYLNKLVLRTQNWNKSSPSLMELRIHLGRSKSRSKNTPRKKPPWLGQGGYGEGQKFMDWEAESTELSDCLHIGHERKESKFFSWTFTQV